MTDKATSKKKTLPRANAEQLLTFQTFHRYAQFKSFQSLADLRSGNLLRAICFYPIAAPRFDAKLFSTYLTIKRFERSIAIERLERFELSVYVAARTVRSLRWQIHRQERRSEDTKLHSLG